MKAGCKSFFGPQAQTRFAARTASDDSGHLGSQIVLYCGNLVHSVSVILINVVMNYLIRRLLMYSMLFFIYTVSRF